jgi:hypothetical protein
MSEFKFACPVCGQHITSDSSASGKHLECPTCFQKIVVPQAPSNPDPKFIISAAQVGKARPVSTLTGGPSESANAPRKTSLIAGIAFCVLLLAAGGAAYAFRGKLFKSSEEDTKKTTGAVASGKKAAGPLPKTYPVPTNIVWTTELASALVPDAIAAGKIHDRGFFCERAILQGGNLTLRQGKSGTADLGITVQFFAQAGEELSGKTVEIAADRQPPLPKVTVRWKDENQKGVTQSFAAGYALKVIFGEAENMRVSGTIFISVPDETKSVVAGKFEAEIRKPAPPKPKTPKTPKPAQPKKSPA